MADGSVSRVSELLEHLEGRNLTARDLPFAREALDLARNVFDSHLLGRALVCCSAAHRSVGQSKEAVELGIEAAALYAKVGDRPSEGVAHYWVGVGLWHERRWSEALVSLERAAAIALEVGDAVRQGRCLNVIAVILGYLGNYHRSMIAYDQALALTSGEGRETERLLLLNNKAQTLLHRARTAVDPESAARDADAGYDVLIPEAMALMERWAPTYRRAIRDTLAQCLLLRGSSRDALDLFDQNLSFAVDNGDEIGAANSRIGLGEAYLDLDQPQHTVDICGATLRDFSTRLHPDDLARGHLALSKAFRLLGQHDKALDAFVVYHGLVRDISKDVTEDYARHMAVIVELEKSKGEAAAYRQLADELRTAQLTAEAASRAKSEFLSNMSHELRTPLNAIIGFADVMRSEMFGAVAPRYRAYIEDIHRSGQHLLELISQLLDLSKAEAGKIELVEETIALDDLIDDAAMLIRESAVSGGIQLDLPPPCGVQVWADPLRLKQCVINLLANAVKFTPAGGSISIAVRWSNDGVAIVIADTGVGLAPEDIPKAFERFGQGGNARAVTGTGLGLPLSKQLIELHGGTVELSSVRSAGTTVILRLPASRVVASVPA